MNQPTASHFDDPLDALEHVVADPVRWWQARAATFFGPRAIFKCSAEKADPGSCRRFRDLLAKIDKDQLMTAAGDDWKRIRQLSLLAFGECVLEELMPLLGAAATPGTEQLLPPLTQADADFFAAARDRLAFTKDPSHWTAADWRLLGFCQDRLGMPPVPTERTPIFLAVESPNRVDGRVLWLVAESLPGPYGLVTPHWWRLGLVPLGAAGELATAIHTGFAEVMNSYPRSGTQFRWWLELHPGGGGWHDQVGEADSVQVSAACVARALIERAGNADSAELLDSRAGVSATLPDGALGASVQERPIGAVDFLDTKIGKAKAGQILTFIVSRPTTVRSDSQIQVHPVRTFDDAYQALLATAAPFQQFKQQLVRHWDASRMETQTHKDFIDAAKATPQ